MKRPLRWTAFAAGATLSAALGAASCADAGEERSPDDLPGPGPSVIPDAGAPEDAACDGDGCAALSPCAETDFCPVTTGPDPRWTLTAVWGTSKDDVWAVGSRGTILHWDGAAWTATPSGTPQTLFAITGSGPNDVWAFSSRGVVLRSTGFAAGAATWTAAPPVAPTYAQYPPQVHNESLLLAAWAGAAGALWTAGEPYPVVPDGERTPTPMNLWRRAKAGSAAAWDHDVIGSSVAVRGLWGDAAHGVWAVGGTYGTALQRAGRTFHATVAAGGAPTWTEIDSQSSTDLHAVWGSSATDVWAVGDRGAVRHWTNATPKRWAIVDVPTESDLRAVWGSGPSDVWVVGDAGTILHFDGETWEPATAAFPLGLTPNLRGVWGSSADDVWIVGDSVVLHSTGKAKSAP
ncbi:MAG: hypothetical protein KIS78_06675 [Labilithrix sp.]|nr:hypothetical protein [Labilithrix sp.]